MDPDFKCGSFGEFRSDLCLARSARQKAEEELKEAKAGLERVTHSRNTGHSLLLGALDILTKNGIEVGSQELIAASIEIQRLQADLAKAREEVEALTQRMMREIAEHCSAKQTIEDWKEEAAGIKERAKSLKLPTHKCRVCGALWRVQLPMDTLEPDETWSLCSKTCGKCCDNVTMGEQIVPAESTDVLNALTNRDQGHGHE